MNYNRLTEKGEPYYAFNKCKTCEYGKDGCDKWCDQITGCFCRLQELEDKIENGELISPNDVGDNEIEFFVKHNAEVRKATAKEIIKRIKEIKHVGSLRAELDMIAIEYGVEVEE